MNTWADYARLWLESPASIPIEDARVGPAERGGYLKTLGDEWGTKASVDQFVEEFVAPYIGSNSLVMEIGSGGGRLVERVAPRCGSLICLDVELEMLQLCRRHCSRFTNVSYVLSSKSRVVVPIRSGALDFVYSFDTFVHLDQRTMFRYFLEIRRILRPSGYLAMHAATHETADGWKHFVGSITNAVQQGDFGSFEYVDSRALIRMAKSAGFSCLDTSLGRLGNFYYQRDVVVLLGSRIEGSR